jgi:hypothetical protein
MNPSPRKNTRSEYPRLQKRTIDASDILIVIEVSVNGLLNEVVEFSFKDTDAKIQAIFQRLNDHDDFECQRDAIDLKRLGVLLLSRFGVYSE